MLVSLDSGSVHVMRSADWRALVDGKDYHALAGARVLVLPDTATPDELIKALRATNPGAPTGAPV